MLTKILLAKNQTSTPRSWMRSTRKSCSYSVTTTKDNTSWAMKNFRIATNSCLGGGILAWIQSFSGGSIISNVSVGSVTIYLGQKTRTAGSSWSLAADFPWLLENSLHFQVVKVITSLPFLIQWLKNRTYRCYWNSLFSFPGMSTKEWDSNLVYSAWLSLDIIWGGYGMLLRL